MAAACALSTLLPYDTPAPPGPSSPFSRDSNLCYTSITGPTWFFRLEVRVPPATRSLFLQRISAHLGHHYDSSHLRSVPACDRPEWLTVEAHNPVAADPTGQWLRALNEAENPQRFSRPDRLLRSRIPSLRFTLREIRFLAH